MASKKPLIPGRGLDAILGNIDVDSINGTASDVTAAISMVPISDIEADVKRKAYKEYLSTGKLPE